MLGAGIRAVTTVAESPPARLLDLSRLISRAGRMPTGIDRVELAYLRAFLAESVPLFGLIKTSLGFVLLDGRGCRGLLDRFDGVMRWGPVDRISRFRRALAIDRQRAEADARRLSVARCLPLGLRRMLAGRVPQGTSYLNVGHANLSDRVLEAVGRALQGQIAVMIHDTIPLDHPHFQRDGTVLRFQKLLRRVQMKADLVLCNSAQTKADVARHMALHGPVPQCLVVPLGVEVLTPEPQVILPVGFDISRPCFITIGTLEPRKNHLFLLDLWARMEADLPSEKMPQLLICGARGWKNEAVFKRLDNDLMMGRHIFELPGLSDGQIAALLAQVQGALFPSHAEGFGLPPAEVLAQGIPVICNDLEIYREILGDYPVYVSVQDSYLWRQEIEKLATDQMNGQATVAGFIPPSWHDHFNVVLSRV